MTRRSYNPKSATTTDKPESVSATPVIESDPEVTTITMEEIKDEVATTTVVAEREEEVEEIIQGKTIEGQSWSDYLWGIFKYTVPEELEIKKEEKSKKLIVETK
jgi:hypothetical protein